MALLKEDNTFTHVIAIDFGTGASGYSLTNIASLSLLNSPIKKENLESKSSIPVMEVMIRKLPLLFSSMTINSLLILELMLFKNMPKSSKMEGLPISFKVYQISLCSTKCIFFICIQLPNH